MSGGYEQPTIKEKIFPVFAGIRTRILWAKHPQTVKNYTEAILAVQFPEI